MHNKDLIHGRICAESFVVSEGKVLLTGFGYAPLLEMGELTALSICDATIAPEVRQRRELSKASDIYSFVVMLGNWRAKLRGTAWYQQATARDPLSRFQKIKEAINAVEIALKELDLGSPLVFSSNDEQKDKTEESKEKVKPPANIPTPPIKPQSPPPI